MSTMKYYSSEYILTQIEQCFLSMRFLINVSRKRYREHNQLVRANVDKSRFLEMNVKEGWKPLCQLLDRPAPDRDFPFRNKSGKEDQTGEFLEDIMEPHIKRCKMEVHQLEIKITRKLTVVSRSAYPSHS